MEMIVYIAKHCKKGPYIKQSLAMLISRVGFSITQLYIDAWQIATNVGT